MNAVTPRTAIQNLQEALSRCPQVEMPTRHYFAGGMYCRELHLAAGTVLVGRVHKQEHFFEMVSGVLRVTSDEGTKTLRAGEIFTSPPGVKRAGWALTDTICRTFHTVSSRDIEVVVEEISEEEEHSLYDAFNQIKLEYKL